MVTPILIFIFAWIGGFIMGYKFNNPSKPDNHTNTRDYGYQS